MKEKEKHTDIWLNNAEKFLHGRGRRVCMGEGGEHGIVAEGVHLSDDWMEDEKEEVKVW